VPELWCQTEGALQIPQRELAYRSASRPTLGGCYSADGAEVEVKVKAPPEGLLRRRLGEATCLVTPTISQFAAYRAPVWCVPFATKTVEAVVRNRRAFRHGFEFLGTDLSEEMHWLK
jgi:hypothetical protein